MMVRVSVAVAFVAITAGAAGAQEQAMPPLAEVARQAEAAKATAKKAKKTYTNANLSADLRGEPTPVTPAPAAAPDSKIADKPVAVNAAAAVEAKGDGPGAQESEESWRNRAASLRKQVEQMRARLAELSTPNQLTDQSPTLKAMTDGEIKNARTAIDGLRKQWARLEASARERKISLAWIEPAPQFPQQPDR